MSNLFLIKQPDVRLSDMTLSSENRLKIKRIITEHCQRRALGEYGLSPTNKLLLVGPAGSGKTMTAEAFATELHIPLYFVIDDLSEKPLQEAVAQLKSIFDQISENRAVYLFNNVGKNLLDNPKVKNLVNSFLLFMGMYQKESLIIVTSQKLDFFNERVLSLFDYAIVYDLPTDKMIQNIFKARLILFKLQWEDWTNILKASAELPPVLW